MAKFKVGDLVRVTTHTHQDGMPDHRVGMIIESEEAYRGEVFAIVFLGTEITMRFHRMFLEPFTTL